MNNVELKKNILVRAGDTIYRILVLEDTRVFLIDCVKKTMPRWMEISSLEVDSCVTEADMREETEVSFPPMDELNADDKKTAHERYTLIAGILALADDEDLRSKLITKVANENGINRRTITNYLCTYLVYQDIAALAPRQRQEKKALTKDQKNIRWALNKYYYTRHGNTLADAYVFMLKEKYTNIDGTLKNEYPSIHQFRYFYKQNKSLQTEYISRGGIKDYQMNHRPLLGDGVQEFAPNVGVGMLDATICDIYLCDDGGNLIGRPVLVACVDAYSGMCCGYSLLWEGGVYSIRELLLNVVTNKAEWCKNFGILISEEDWNCDKLPGILVTDMGSEYKSFHFEQISDLGCTVVNLPSFRPELKGPVEKLFSLVQDSFKPYLKGKGVIEPDFQKRGQHDYRKDARLTLRDFETIILRCIIHHNKQRILENFPYTEDMLAKEIKPHPSNVWNYGIRQPGANLIAVTREKLVLTMLPRTNGKFTRYGLTANKLRYGADGYTERYLSGGNVTIAYNPEDVSVIYLIEDDYARFDLIESRYQGKPLAEVEEMQRKQKSLVTAEAEDNIRARVELAQHIETVASQSDYKEDVNMKSVRTTRKRARSQRHKDFTKEVSLNG